MKLRPFLPKKNRSKHLKHHVGLWIVLISCNVTYAQSTTLPASYSPAKPAIYWSFDETDGTAFIDQGPQRYVGHVVCSDGIHASPHATGFLGGALLCGGSKQHGCFMEVENIQPLKGPFTISAWVKSNHQQWCTRIFYYRPYWTSNTGFDLQMNGMTTFLSTCINGDQKSVLRLPMLIGPQTGYWSFVTIVWDGELWRVYLNGLSVATSHENELPAYSCPPDTTKLLIGGYNTQTNNTFCGLIDEVKIWLRSLTPKEIEQVMLEDLKKQRSQSRYP